MNKARIAGIFYVVTFIAGTLALVVRGRVGSTAGFIAGACYIVVTLLLYFVFKPVSRPLSLLAASVSFVGLLRPLHQFTGLNPLVFFGCYCLLIAYLLFKSPLAPKVLAALMVFAGLGWLTFLSAPLAAFLSPYNFAPGMIGEGALTVWLLMSRADVMQAARSE